MNFTALLGDKAIKSKQKTELLSDWILANANQLSDLLTFAKTAKDAGKAICIEAIEFATRRNPAIGSSGCFDFAVAALAEKAPRIKWEAAKVIGNIAHLHTNRLEPALAPLLDNTAHEGTVVRWSAAFALGEIIKLKTVHNADLIPAVESVCAREEKNSIRKIYQDALKKVKK